MVSTLLSTRFANQRHASGGAVKPARRVASLLLLLLPTAVFASAQLRLHIDEVAGQGWIGKDIVLKVAFSAGETSLTVTIDKLEVAQWSTPFRQLRFTCQRFSTAPGVLQCESLLSNFYVGEGMNRQPLQALLGFRIDWSSGEILHTRLEVAWDELRGDTLQRLLSAVGTKQFSRLPTFSTGSLTGRATLTANNTQPSRLLTSFSLRDFAFSDELGMNAGENFSADITVSAEIRGEEWVFRSSAELLAADLFLNPLYLTWRQNGPQLALNGSWWPSDQRLRFTSRYQHAGYFELSAGGEVMLAMDHPELVTAYGRVRVESLENSYQTYLQPWLVDSLIGDLQASGRLSGRGSYHQDRGITSLALELHDIDLIDQQQRFSVSGLSANLPWQGIHQPSEGDVHWRALQLYRLPFGQGSSQLRFIPSQLTLDISPITLFDGSFTAAKVVIDRLGTDELALTLGARLTPVSLPPITAALGWPEMAGTLAARVPAVHYQGGKIEVDGAIDLNVFDGNLSLSRLTIENLFGLVPRLSADIRGDNLDLALLTHTFGFGDISGRIEGYIDGLQLEAWQPVAFDAWLQTPPNDPGRHQISQRALDSLSSIGGISGALQSTLLRFFNDFSYRRLGIGCRLAKGVCQMRGIADRGTGLDQGYYIVQGGGLWPRIDLVGHNRRVDWQVLVQRLIAATDVENVEFR